MAAYAALVSLINNVEQITNHPRLSSCFDNEQIESILQKAGSMLEFIEGGGCNHGGLHFTQETEALEREITSAAHAAEDVIESHVVHTILAEKESTNVCKKVLNCAIGIARAIHRNRAGTVTLEVKEKEARSIDLQQLIQHMGAVAERAMEVMKKEGVREEEEKPPTDPTPPHVGETAMVGLDDELTQLLGSLTDDRSNRHVISIVGMGGTGKTTLAQNLYAHPLVKEKFDTRAWATISQQYDLKQILSQFLSCLDKSTEGEVGELGERLHKTLYGIRYLIVLDDVWGVEAWDRVRRYLPDSGNSSRVVITTRLSNVASDCGSTCFDLNLLDEGKSWDLFCVKAMFPLKDGPPQLEDVAKKIVKSCKGLALSIVVIGGLLLKSPRSVGYWENVLKGLETNDSKEKQQGLDALSLSYNHLPPHLKPCFLYMGTFEEDSRIRASNITRLWVAEGFIKPKGSRVLEEIAEDHLKDLSDRNLILGLEHGFTGKIKSFSIHDLLRDLCIKVGEQQEFFHVWKPNKSQGRIVRRVVCDEPCTYESGAALARSFLGQNYSMGHVKHKLLRVFDATGNESTEDVYGNNVNLRYLAHERLSANVCLVWNLQTLIVSEIWSKLIVAPLGIWKMRQLRHVKCNDVYLPDSPRDGQGKMENLQTLKRAVNLRLSEETCEIIPNIKNLVLTYDPSMQGYDDSFIECLRNLDRFHKLESLSMRIRTSKWPDRDPKLNTKLAFPISMKKLWLESCKLCWADMSLIGSLPQLQVLHLKHQAVSPGKHQAVSARRLRLWKPVGGQFLSLKFLEIERCDLRCWVADSSHFPVLEKLLLRRLNCLEEIPQEIGEIPTLRLIRVKLCSESAAISAVKIKKDQVENYDNDDLQIEVVVHDYEVERFKKRVEEEELPLDLFKLET